MKITTIKYMERKNLGNYEHKEITAEAFLEEGENHTATMLALTDFVKNALEGIVNTPIKDKIAEVEAPKKEVVKKASIKVEAKVEEKTEVIEEEVSQVEGDVPPVIPEEARTKAPAKETVKKVKVVNYNSAIPSHKTRLTSFLNTEVPSWKVPPTGADEARTKKYFNDIKEYTASLNGKPFEDMEANMLPDFKQSVLTKISDLKK